MSSNSFRHSSKIFLNFTDSEYYSEQLRKQNIINLHRGVLKEQQPLAGAILDSSLITPTGRKLYDTKIVQCGKYFQMYKYTTKRSIKISNKDFNTKLIPMLGRLNSKSIKKNLELKHIELKNVNRAKFNLQRLVKANEECFKTFLTLTFEENIVDISIANKKFSYWVDHMRRNFKNYYLYDSDYDYGQFKYIMIPEIQKSREKKYGFAVIHYHLLTNIPYDSDLFKDEIKLWSPKDKKYNIGKPLNSWSYGYSLAKKIDNLNVVGYLTKYMTKDIDSRFFGYRKYTYSYNLKRPSTVYLNSEIINDYSKIFLIEQLYDLNYNTYYSDKYTDSLIYFNEYKI